jgi:von Willebrand factor type A domain
MIGNSRPRKQLGSWLRLHSLTLVAALGGAAGVAYAAGWHMPSSARATARAMVAAEDAVQDTVQVALLLDTSGSMDGLLNQARSQLWKMVDDLGRMTRVVDGKTRHVKIELALYEYGNDAISADAGYIRQVLPFTTDLDTVSEQLHGLVTNGGSEFVGQAIATSAAALPWSADPAALRFVFVAGNEEFDQGPVTAATAMAAAARKDINVQLIYCGPTEPTWAAAARLAKSELVTIDHNQVAQYIASPQDAEILRLGNELNRTYLAYGADGIASVERQARADASSARLSPNVALERAQLKGTRNYNNANWDVVDAVENNARFLEQAGDAELPAELRGKRLAEKQQIVAANAARRAELSLQIRKLEAERTAFLETARAPERGATARSLETALMKSATKIAANKGYRL